MPPRRYMYRAICSAYASRWVLAHCLASFLLGIERALFREALSESAQAGFCETRHSKKAVIFLFLCFSFSFSSCPTVFRRRQDQNHSIRSIPTVCSSAIPPVDQTGRDDASEESEGQSVPGLHEEGTYVRTPQCLPDADPSDQPTQAILLCVPHPPFFLPSFLPSS